MIPKLVAAVLLLHCIASFAVGYNPPAGSPLAKREHPRIWITTDNLGEIKARLATGGALHSDFAAWIAWLDSEYERAVTNGAYLTKEDAYALNFAFAYLTHPVPGITYRYTREQYGAKAKELYLLLLSSRNFGGPDSSGKAITYDWINTLLTQQEKQLAAAWFKKIDQTGFAQPDAQTFNSFKAIDGSHKVLAGLALAGDGIDDSWAAASVDSYLGIFRGPSGVSTANSFYGGNHGGFGQGILYGIAYTLPPIIGAEEAYRTAMGLSRELHYSTPDTNVIRFFPHYYLRSLLPDAWPKTYDPAEPDGYHWNFWKGEKVQHPGSPSTQSGQGIQALLSVKGLYSQVDPAMASLAAWLIRHRASDPTGFWPYFMNWVPYRFVFGAGGATVAEKGPVELGLPLSQQHDRGWWTFRTSWNSTLDEPMVTISAQKWYAGGHSMRWPGDFSIDRKGPVAFHQGGTGGHDWVGSSLAGNILVFPDRTLTQKRDDLDDEGGHRIGTHPDPISIADWVEGGRFDTRGAAKFQPAQVGIDADYVWVDLTKAYGSVLYHDSYNPARLRQYVRQFVYFRPARPVLDPLALIIFDRVETTDTKFEKNWYLHTAAEPQVDGSESLGPARGPFGTEGKWTYRGATQVTANNNTFGSNSTLYLTPLLPTERLIVKVGGPNSKGESWKPDGHEFESPYGIQGTLWGVPEPWREQYVGEFRVEIIPATPSLYDVFLNVIEVGDAGFPKSQVARLSGSELVGVRIGQRIAVFHDVEGSISSGTLTIDLAGTYQILIADLTPRAEYSVQLTGTELARTASSNAGTLFLPLNVPAPNSLLTVTRTGAGDTIAPQRPAQLRIQ